MDLVKPYLDFALFTARAEPLIEFWRDEIGATLEGKIAIREGHDQHRMNLAGSGIKINELRELPNLPPSGFRTLIVARSDVLTPKSFTDPDGNKVILAPPGHRGVTQVGICLGVRDTAAHGTYYGETLGFERIGTDAFRVGESAIVIDGDPAAHPDPEFTGPGWRYLTLQVVDIKEDIAGYEARGGRIGQAVQQFGSAVRFGTVRDPDGNWLEIVQRATPEKPFD